MFIIHIHFESEQDKGHSSFKKTFFFIFTIMHMSGWTYVMVHYDRAIFSE